MSESKLINAKACLLTVGMFVLAGGADSSSQGSGRDPADAASVIRETTTMVALRPNGVSEPVDFVIPRNTRSITVVVEGDPLKLYALASLRTGEGAEHVNVDVNGTYGSAMENSYNIEQVGQMPGDLYQAIRLGIFTHVYPYAPGQSLADGPSQLRVASNATSGQVKVTILMPADDDGKTLHVNLIAASDTFTIAQPPTFLPAVQTIFDQAGIRVVVDEIKALTGTSFNRITEWTEPQEAPPSQSAQLAVRGQSLVSSEALNIYIVDSLPTGIDGLSLGTPGPPLRSSYYYGVVLPHITSDEAMAQIFAHEVSHFLALQHVTNTGASGKHYAGPIPDTKLGQDNLMENGTVITPGQAFALTRSALLRMR